MQRAMRLTLLASSMLCILSAAKSEGAEELWDRKSPATEAKSAVLYTPMEEELAGACESAVRESSSVWSIDESLQYPTVEFVVIPVKFAQVEVGEQIPPPSSYLDSDDPQLSISEELSRLNQRIDELETARRAHEDATRTLIRQSYAERGSNINDYVVFGGTLETLTFWSEDFDGIAQSDIVLDTLELDFEVQVNDWTVGSFILQYDDGTDIIFPTTEADEFGVDRLNVDTAFITVGNTQRYPIYGTFGRIIAPFGISTGDPVADVLTIIDPLTVEVFETREDVVLIGFEWPTPPPPPPVSGAAAPAPLPPRPLLINPLVRRSVNSLCNYCGYPTTPPEVPVAVPPTCQPPITGALYFYNGDTIDGAFEEDHIEHMGGTLGYRTKGLMTQRLIPWSIDLDVDVNSSVFDSNFLQFEYRSFLDQIGYVPGMAAHAKSTVGPYAFVIEWNGAIDQAEFIDDAGTPVAITPSAWQASVAYQFDWNPSVEFIGAQGTYVVFGYSESSDLAGVTRIFDPLVPVLTRVGFVPERRLSAGIGEWVLPGLRVALEYSHAIDYDVDDGGTGNNANGFFWQLTYEW